MVLCTRQGRIQVFFLGADALVSCSTSTPINHIVFFLQNTSCIRKPQVISGVGGGVRTPCTLPLDPPLHVHGKKCLRDIMVLKVERFRLTVKVNLYHLTKPSLNWCLTVHYFYPQIFSFTLVLSITIVLDCF